MLLMKAGGIRGIGVSRITILTLSYARASDPCCSGDEVKVSPHTQKRKDRYVLRSTIIENAINLFEMSWRDIRLIQLLPASIHEQICPAEIANRQGDQEPLAHRLMNKNNVPDCTLPRITITRSCFHTRGSRNSCLRPGLDIPRRGPQIPSLWLRRPRI
jgi:hypothetical protein